MYGQSFVRLDSIIQTMKASAKQQSIYIVAAKTNVLYDIAGVPNIGMEVMVNRHISVAGEFAYSHWSSKNTYHLQTTQGGLAGKYWFNYTNKKLIGWNVGAYATMGGKYDVQWKQGYQGDKFYSGGIQGGYALELSRRFHLEFVAAAGYFYTPEVRHYHYGDREHLVWKETRYNVGRLAPTKLQVNLVWVLNGNKNRTCVCY